VGLEPVADFKVDQVKYGKLRDEHLQVYRDGESISATHTPTGIIVTSDHRSNVNENWELVQQGLNSALEHQESVGMTQPERGGRI